MRVGAICAGYGGLELGLAAAGVDTRLKWFAEIDRAASEVMAARFGAPNLGDVTTIHAPPHVDIVTAGFPCQPVSTAGRRKGVQDERWIIDSVCRAARDAGARWLILENVVGLLSANGGDAMARTCAAMAENGFGRWEWATFRASDVGACHRRERWFCIARAADADSEPARRHTAADAGTQSRNAGRPTHNSHRPTDAAANLGPYGPAVARWADVIGRPAPEPLNSGRLSPAFVEWMMGLPAGWVTGLGHSRTQQLKMLGNGVVPQQAAHAITTLGALL